MATRDWRHWPEERKALLQAVCENPEDNAPRLRYADYLAATGNQVDVARAEVIRVQCELGQGDLDDVRWGELSARQAELTKAYQEKWKDELPDLPDIVWHYFDLDRGFTWSLACLKDDALIKNAALIFASAPIHSISLKKITKLKRLLDLPQIRSVTRLIATETNLRADDARTLAESPNLAGLTALHISGNRLGDAGADELAKSQYLRRLENLDLSDNGLTDAGVIAIASSPIAATLGGLAFANTDITDVGARALMNSPHLTKLWGLTLWNCDRISSRVEAQLKKHFGDVVSFMD